MSGELIGEATLEVGANLVPLDTDLAKAERKVATAVAAMQAMLDKLSLHVRDDGIGGGALAGLTAGAATMASSWDTALASVRASLKDTDRAIGHTAEVTVAASEVEVAAIDKVTRAYLEQAAAARAAADAGEVAAGRALGVDALALAGLRGGGGSRTGAAFATREQRGGGQGLTAAELAAIAGAGIEGVRGKGHAGSRVDPLVVVLEAGRYTPLGGMSAAIGYQGLSGAATTTVAQGGSQGGATNILTSSRTPGEPPLVAPVGASEDRSRAVQDAALAAGVAKLAEAIERPLTSPGRPGAAPEAVAAVLAARKVAESATPGGVILPTGVQAKGSGSDKAVPVIVTETEPKATQAEAAATAAALADLAGREIAPGQRAKAGPAYRAAYEALGYTVASRVPGGPARLYAAGGQPGTGSYGLTAEAAALAAAHGGGSAGGGGGVPPWLAGLLWGSHGGGGGPRLPGWWGTLAGVGGIGAGFGSLGSFAGFGPEHILLTGGGIVGSGVAALGGGALLAGGALGKVGVGMGSDAAVMSSTIADTKSLYTAYENLHLAIVTYGKGSEKAIEAQYELNKVLNELGHTAGVTAETGLAQATRELNKLWDASTGGARVQAVKVLSPIIELARAYVPLVAHAAEQNFSASATGLKPLFEWLRGPEGMGIFLELEQEFRTEIPTAMKALDMGVQFFAKTIAYTAPLTGAFLTKLDEFFTKWNSPGEFAVWEGEMQKLIADFHVWGAFLRELGGALVDLFNKDAHTGQGIIEVLTQMLHKLREWENSTSGAASIRNIFTLHKEEVIELLKALVPLVSSFSHIYLTVAPPLVKAVTEIARGFDWLLETIEKGGKLGEWAIGLAIIAGKLKLLTPLVTALKNELKGTAAAEGEAAAGATGLAGAETAAGAGAGVELAGGGGVLLRGASGLSAGESANAATNAEAGAAESAGAGSLLSQSTLLKGGLAGFVGLLLGSLTAGAVGAKGTLGNSISGAGAGAGLGYVGGGAISGAILGTEITPVVGTAIGAVLGAATPYAVKFLGEVFATHAPNYGKKLAEGILGPQSALGTSHLYQPGIEGALNAAHRAGKPTGLSRGVAATIVGVTGSLPVLGPALGPLAAGLLGGSGPNRAAQAKDEKTAGERVAQAFVAGFNEVRFPTKSVLLAQMQETLNKLPVGARLSAAKAMVAYAQELESKGEIPKGAVNEVIHGLESQFPHLAAYLEQQGQSMASEFAAALHLKQAQAALATSLDKISQLFGTSNADTISNAEHTMSELAFVIAHSKGAVKKAAEEAFGELSHVVSANFEAAKNAVAVQTAGINQQLESEFKALGMPTKISVGKEGLVLSHPNPIGGTPFGKAQGGLLQIGRPGEAGRDTVPLNVGGLPIAVGAGEQVAVFNRHQLPIVNAALAPLGGLPGLFQQVSTPNYMASGGIVAPHVGGTGAISALVRDAVGDVAQAASQKLGKVSASASAAGAGPAGGGPPASANEALGRRMMIAAGFPASEWGYLQKLWQKESGWSTTAQNPTSSAYGIPQDITGALKGKGAREQIAWGLSYIRGRYGSPAAAWAHEMAYNWYGKGGLLGFAEGGLLAGGPLVAGFSTGGTPSPGTRLPRKAKRPPQAIKRAHLRRLLEPLSSSWGGHDAWVELNALMGESGTVEQLIEKYALEKSADELGLSGLPHGGDFVVTPSALEKVEGHLTPYEIPGNVHWQGEHLEGMRGTESTLAKELASAWIVSEHVLKAARKAIDERKKAIAELRAKIQANLAAIKKHREEIKQLDAQLAALHKGEEKQLETQLAHVKAAKKTPALYAKESELENQLYALSHGKGAATTSAEKKLEGRIHGEKAQVKALEAENARLGGAPGSLGTGGEIGKLSAEVTKLTSNEEATKGWKHDIGGIKGSSGKVLETHVSLEELARQITALGGVPRQLQEALLEGGSGESVGGGPESTAELAERQKAQTEEELKVKTAELLVSSEALKVFGGPGDIGKGAATAFAAAMAQGGTFTGFGGFSPLPYAGAFGAGGVIPGPLGHAAVAVVHGGEEVRTPEQQEPRVIVEQNIHTLHPGDPTTLTAIGKAATRGIGYQGLRKSKRWVPGI